MMMADSGLLAVARRVYALDGQQVTSVEGLSANAHYMRVLPPCLAAAAVVVALTGALGVAACAPPRR
jgi:hypothetical protein